jgi:UDP-glucose 4-epimerase
MQKVIITGGAGFIGSHLSDQLISQGVEVIIIDNLSTGKKENLNPKAFFVDINLSMVNVKELHWQLFPMKFFRNVDVVFHLAATPQVQYSIDNPTDNNNLISLINTLELSKKIEAKKFVFSSSSAVYGNPKHTPISEEHPTNPLSPYALHKLIGEQYCKMYSEIYDLNTVCLRYFNVYGDRMPNKGAYRSVISIFKEQFNKKQPLNIVNDGEQKRDFVHVNDIVQANLLAANLAKNYKGDIFNVGTGQAYTVNKIADMFGGNKKYGEKRIEPKNSIAENAKIMLDLNWEPKNNLKTWINTFTKQN